MSEGWRRIAGVRVNMARVNEAETVEVYEVGNEPEYFVSNLLKYDRMSGGLVRLYFGSRRAKNVCRLEYTVVIPTDALVVMAREAIDIASDAHNTSAMLDGGEKLN